MNENKKYLLTGASGFLGSIIKDFLTANNIEIVGLDLFGRPRTVDISHPFNLNKDLEIDVVVHAAGKAHTFPRTKAEEEIFFHVNFEGTKNLCDALDRLAVKPSAFIFISSVAVYGVHAGTMVTENHPLGGATPYSKSKILAENYLVEWTARRGIKLGIMRLPLIAGPNPPGNLGAMISGIRSGRYLSIGKANSSKSIVWQEDIAAVIPALAKIGGTYNLTDGYHPSFKELEQVISKALNKKLPIRIPKLFADILGRFGDLLGKHAPVNSDKVRKITSTLTFDDSKARQLLNWKSSAVLDKMTERL
ncbi:MAG: NAD-dependent epimerase/dehydratase family protein [Sphingobacteriaceae bacterium]